MTTIFRQYHGESAENRINTRRQTLMDLALSAIVDDEWRTLSISELCRRGGLHKRYFYESFATLDDVVATLIEETSSRIVTIAFEEVRAATQDGCTPKATSERVIGAMMAYLMEDTRRARILFTDIADSPLARQKRKQMLAAFSGGLAVYSRYHYNRKNRTAPKEQLYISVLVGGTIAAFMAWMEGDIPMTQQEFTDDLASLWLNTGDSAAKAS